MGRTLEQRLVPEPLRAELDALVAERDDVRLLRLILGEARIFEWVHAVGVLQEPRLAAHVPPIPPEHLRKIVADWQRAMFLWTGYLDACAMARRIEAHVPVEGARILDFGAGCGRVIRFFEPVARSVRLHGADVNPEPVAWCRDHLRFATFTTCGAEPPLPYEKGSLDCIYAISVMTHIDLDASRAWLDEFRRVLRPGGVAIVTTHGVPVLEQVMANETLQAQFRLSAARAREILATLPSAGWVFLPYDPDTMRLAHAGSRYGLSFSDARFVQERLAGSGAEVVSVEPGGQRGWQDVTVLRFS